MIEVEHLTKRYGPVAAVSDVSFRCMPGTVTGFVGPNGAGKSTTLRMICGLANPSAARATVPATPNRAIPNPRAPPLAPPPGAVPNPARHVGVLLDAAAQHGGRTGKETLTVAAMTLGVE